MAAHPDIVAEADLGQRRRGRAQDRPAERKREGGGKRLRAARHDRLMIRLPAPSDGSGDPADHSRATTTSRLTSPLR